MKISVQFEADSADDYDRIIEALAGPGRAMFHVNQPKDEVLTVDASGKPYTPKHDDDWGPTPEPESPKIKPSEAEKPTEKPIEPPVVAAKRGRPFKAKPVEEAPVQPPQPPLSGITPMPPFPMPPAQKSKAEPIEVLSRQDLLDVFSEYVSRYGINFGYTDISNLLQQHLGDGVRKASDVPEGSLPVAIGAIRSAISDNPFNRKRDYNA